MPTQIEMVIAEAFRRGRDGLLGADSRPLSEFAQEVIDAAGGLGPQAEPLSALRTRASRTGECPVCHGRVE